MAIVLNGTTGITNDGGYTGDGVVFADTTPANTLVTTTGGNVLIGDTSAAGTGLTLGNGKDLWFKATGYNTWKQVNYQGGLYWNNGSDRVVIDSSGKLLVGTTSPAYNTRVESQGGFSSLGHPQFNITSTSSSTAFEWVLRSGTEMQFYVNNAAVVARLTTSGVWTNASDARHKENIRPITYGLAEVLQLQPRAYNIIGSEKQEIGFVAQEVEPVLPELVESARNSITEEDRLTLSYGQMSAVLVKAIQEQQAIITALTARVAALEGK